MKKLQLLCLLSLFFSAIQAQNNNENSFLKPDNAFIYSMMNASPKTPVQHSNSTTQISKTIDVTTAGTLINLLTSEEKSNVSSLTITGKIDARDFKFLRDSMPVLTELDMSNVSIVAYAGSEGTMTYSVLFPANEIPQLAFSSIYSMQYNEIVKLNSIVLPNSITSIGNYAFAFNITPTSINIPATVSKIGFWAFVGCSAKLNVDEANPNFSSVDGVLFNKDYTKLLWFPSSTSGNYVIPSTVKTVGDYSFYTNGQLTSVSIPASVDTIGDEAFKACSALLNVDANNSNYASQEGVLFNKSMNKLVQCPISKSGSYTIPSSVDTLGSNCFYSCKLLTDIELPSTINYIAYDAFDNCIGLNSLTLNGLRFSAYTSDYYFFYGINRETCVLYVPYGAKPLYESSSAWRNFTNIVETTHGFSLGTNRLILSYEANSQAKVPVLSIDGWTVSSNQSWLKVSPENGTGSDSILFSAEANTLYENRTAIVQVMAEGFETQSIQVIQKGIPKILNVSAGELYSNMTSEELKSVMNLQLSGSMDARDFRTMRDSMPKLNFVDLSEVNIIEYNGAEGTSSTVTSYPANRIPDYAFNTGVSTTTSTLREVKLPTTINAIGNYAFYSCTAFTDIEIPSSVNYIGNHAFGLCNSLEKITLPNTITSIENYAFYKTAISEITIPNTVKTIGAYSFSFCAKLNQIDIPNSVITIANSAFENCFALFDLILGDSVSSIGNSAFSQCKSIKNQIIPNSVLSLGSSAFASCGNLQSVILSDSLKTISSSCFASCSNLKSIIIPKQVKTIEMWAFNNCTSLSTLSLPNSISTISGYAFSNCTGLTTIKVNADTPTEISGGFDSETYASCSLNVPFGSIHLYKTSNYIWKNFQDIVEDPLGFKLESNFVQISYANGSSSTISINSNNEWNLSSNESWLKVSPETGTGNDSIRFIAEENSSSLPRQAIVTVSSTGVDPRTITITQLATPKFVNTTAGNLFTALSTQELDTITNLKITGTIDARDFKTMQDNMPLLSVLDLSDVKIASYTGTAGTYSSSYSYAANQIPYKAFSKSFSGKTSLITVILPTSINSIGSSAFAHCGGLTNIEIPSSVNSIGSSAFSYCLSLNKLNMPSSIKTIEAYCFSNCINLKEITLPATLTTINNNAFEICMKLNYIKIPNTVTFINKNAFQYCNSLTEVNLPESLKYIGNNAFDGCSSVTNLTIPTGISSIGTYALGCSGLKSITALATTPLVLDFANVFYGVNKYKCILYVPTESKTLYSSTAQWQDFANIIEMTTALPTVAENSNINIYPNPATEMFSVSGLDGAALVSILDLNGKVLFSKQITGLESVSVTGLPKGVYIARITSQAATIDRKLIKK